MYAKASLAKMNPGEVLEIIADGMCTKEGLPDAISMLGHKLLKVEALNSGLFRYLIEAQKQTSR
jgi:TusA-related sulfurtransferase